MAGNNQRHKDPPHCTEDTEEPKLGLCLPTVLPLWSDCPWSPSSVLAALPSPGSGKTTVLGRKRSLRSVRSEAAAEAQEGRRVHLQLGNQKQIPRRGEELSETEGLLQAEMEGGPSWREDLAWPSSCLTSQVWDLATALAQAAWDAEWCLLPACIPQGPEHIRELGQERLVDALLWREPQQRLRPERSCEGAGRRLWPRAEGRQSRWAFWSERGNHWRVWRGKH